MKTRIVLELVDNEQLNITGPLETSRDLCARMLKEAWKVVEGSKSDGGLVTVANGCLFADLSMNPSNEQIRKIL